MEFPAMKLLVVALAFVALGEGVMRRISSDKLVQELRDALRSVDKRIKYEIAKYPDETFLTVSKLLKQVDHLIDVTVIDEIDKELEHFKEGVVNWYNGYVLLRKPIFATAERLNDLTAEFDKIVGLVETAEEKMKQLTMLRGGEDVKRSLSQLWDVIQPDLKGVQTGVDAANLVSADAVRILLDRAVHSSPEKLEDDINHLTSALEVLEIQLPNIISRLVQ